MIVVKTHMRKLPRCCAVCRFYHSGHNSFSTGPECGAMSAYQPVGRIIFLQDSEFVQPTKGRQMWCPLKEGRSDAAE